MFRRYALGFQPVKQMSTMSSSATPIEDAIRSKVSWGPFLCHYSYYSHQAALLLHTASTVHEPKSHGENLGHSCPSALDTRNSQ